MPEYIVKTGEGRNLIIAADRYEIAASTDTYNFYKDHTLVGSVNSRAVLAVLEFEDAYQADYDNADPLSPDNQDDPSGPEIGEPSTLLGNPRTDIPAPSLPVPETPTAVPDQVNEPLTKVEYRLIRGVFPSWGFTAEGYFIPFGKKGKEESDRNAASYKEGEWATWGNFPLSETELAEVPSE